MGISMLIWALSLCVRYIFRLKVIEEAPLFLDGEELRSRVLEAPDKLLPYVFVRGVVVPHEDILCLEADISINGVLMRATVTETIATHLQGWRISRRRSVRWIYSSAVPFLLRYDGHVIRVVKAEEADQLALPAVKFVRRLNEHSTSGLWMGLLRRLATVVEVHEEMVRAGAYVTVGGEVTVADDGSLLIGPSADWLPMILTGLTKAQLVLRGQRQIVQDSLYAKLTFAATVIFCAFAYAVTDLLM
uniref:RING-type E3 ubiquitin transferase n=1 Tax=Anopheles dirus TaxID=7168 RepID=A0A182N090_9DIPT